MLTTARTDFGSARPSRTVPRGETDSPSRLHICNGLVPSRDGGMVPSILGMTGALAGRACATDGRFPVEILTLTASDDDAFAVPDGLPLRGPADRDDLASAIARAELVHIHGLWQSQTRVGAALAERARVPYLVAAHGMADPWALRQKRWKKQVYGALIESRRLRSAACLHALARPEVTSLRRLAPRTPICWIPNGVDPRPFDDLPDRRALEAAHPELVGKFVVLFFGRLHVKKGLDLLAEAMITLASRHPDLHLVLAGRDDGAWEPFRDRLAATSLLDRVTRLGHVGGESARAVWGAADAFVLPSYSEGFSMAILEAMAASKPVLITETCYFPEVARHNAGLIVAPTVSGVTEGLDALRSASGTQRDDWACRARRLVLDEYTWDRQAERLEAVYDWLAHGAPRPDSVVLP